MFRFRLVKRALLGVATTTTDLCLATVLPPRERELSEDVCLGSPECLGNGGRFWTQFSSDSSVTRVRRPIFLASSWPDFRRS
jgi:hypothetical protein